MSGKIEISRELAEREFSEFWEQHKLDLLERKIGRSDCKSIWLAARNVAARVVERQPVAIVDESDDGMFIEFIYGENGNPLQRGDILYADPPAPVAVLLPERRNDDCDRSSPNSWTDWGMGWNACLDKVKELNQ